MSHHQNIFVLLRTQSKQVDLNLIRVSGYASAHEIGTHNISSRAVHCILCSVKKRAVILSKSNFSGYFQSTFLDNSNPQQPVIGGSTNNVFDSVIYLLRRLIIILITLPKPSFLISP